MRQDHRTRIALVVVAFAMVGGVGCGGGRGPQSDGPVANDGEVEDERDTRAEAPEGRTRFDYCDPTQPPDETCYAVKRAPASEQVVLAEAVGRSFLARREATSLGWNWEEAVGMFALTELSRVTGEARFRDFVAAWLDHHIEHGYTIVTSDSCAPALPALALLAHAGEERYRTVVAEALHYLYEVALRDEEGGINHLGITDLAGVTLWVDSLFMFGMFLIRYGEFADDARALDEFGRQLDVFTRRLQDASGFYVHAWNWVLPQDEGVFWARGNAWVAAAAAEYLRVRQVRGERDEAAEAAFSRLVSAVLRTQDPETGLWWTVVNRPGETYLETSASALFAWALARAWRYGLVGDEVLPAVAGAIRGLRAQVRPDLRGRAIVTGISGPTGVGGFENYKKVPVQDDLPYGMGAVVLALVESSGLPIPPGPPTDSHPRWMVRPEDRGRILARLEREPYASILATLRQRAAREYAPTPLGSWDHEANGRNGETAQDAAFLAWLEGDESLAAKVRDFFRRLPTDYETHTVPDINIRMPHTLIGYANAWDLLMGTAYFPQEEAETSAQKLCDITRKFFGEFVESDVIRQIWLGVSQNNHPIRTAAAIGYVALVLPQCEGSREWADWAASEMAYLWGPEGRYVQPDGGISEGPFYYGFGLSAALPFLLAMDLNRQQARVFRWNCVNRQDVDPWAPRTCVDGEPFLFPHLLRDPWFHASVDWWITLRLPSGWCPPLGDARMRPLNGVALFTAFAQDPGRYRFAWETTLDPGPEMTAGMDLTPYHLAWFEDVVSSEPPWTSRFLPAAGNAVFRSGWDHDALWLLLVAEHGPARKTLHDHVDGTSFSLAAYGEYLLVDPGYYKPNPLDNAKTAHAPSHNVILIDGRGAPNKGYLTDFGDTDAFLKHPLAAGPFEHAEAWQTYENTRIERSVVFVRGRYFVVADRLATSLTSPREHAWRVHGNAGYTAGGTFTMHPDGPEFVREAAGVRVHLASTKGPLAFREPDYTPLTAPHVHEFDRQGKVADHAVVDGVVNAVAPQFLAVLAPYRLWAVSGDPDAPLDVEEVPTGSGAAAFLVTHAGGRDLVWVREPDGSGAWTLPEGRSFETDAIAGVMGLDDGAILLIRGSRVGLDGVWALVAGGTSGVGAGSWP